MRMILLPLCNYLTAGYNGVGAGVFYRACSEMQGNGLKLRRWKYKLDSRKKKIHCWGGQALE